MPFVDITPRARLLLRSMAGTWADRHIDDVLLPCLSAELETYADRPDDLREGFADPYLCLRAIYSHYAFARRGKDRLDLAKIAVAALDKTADPLQFDGFLAEKDAAPLWNSFARLCEEEGFKPMEQTNRGLISGLAELAQEIYRADGVGSIAEWVVREIATTERVEQAFERIVDIRGVGPKLTSVLLRDIVLIYGLEGQLSPIDRLYIQPIDKWMRLIAPHVVEEEGIEDAADWILAGKLAKYSRHGGVSGVRFNIGASAFGMGEVKSPQNFDRAIANLLDSL